MRTALLTLGLLFILPGIASASWYPPDYVTDSKCVSDGPVEVCVYNRSSAKPFVKVIYNGYLMAESWGKIGAWVGVNGKWGQFQLQNSNYKESVKFNHYRNVQLCYHNTTMTRTSTQYDYCPNATATSPMSFDWYREDPPQSEKDMVGSGWDNPSGWYVEVAVYDDKGRWDSRYGYNYRILVPRY